MKPSLTERGQEIVLYSVATAAVGAAIVLGTVYDNAGAVQTEDITRALVLLAGGGMLAALVTCLVSVRLVRLLPLALYLLFCSTAWLEFDLGSASARWYWTTLGGYASLVLTVLAAHVLLERMDRMRAAWLVMITAVAMGAGTGLAIARNLGGYGQSERDAPALLGDWALEAMAATTPAELPDILYIVPDRYGSAETLQREYGFDNETFYRALERRGFDVERNTWANYSRTELSLASVLNSTYLDRLSDVHGIRTSDRTPIYRMIENNAAQQVLRAHGYRFHNYGNWWEPTRVNRWAHVNDQGYKGHFAGLTNEFERAVLRRISLPGTGGGQLSRLRMKTLAYDPIADCERIGRKMETLATFGNAERPVFAFAHVLIPHEPIVIGADGRCLGESSWVHRDAAADFDGFKRAGIEFLQYFNASVLEIVDRQLESRGNTDRELIVVIQSDEGPHPLRHLQEGKRRRYSVLDRREILIKTGTVNALRIPGRNGNVLEGEPTPINNYRIIVDAVLGTNTGRLPHRVFLPGDSESFYDFRELTEEVLRPPRSESNS